ncbi:MAG: multidrug transporter [Hyphomicrobiales bacterium]|nr:multidrug transporter [Hyphomicrobiales bacterium]
MAVLLLLVFLKQVGNGMVWSVIAVYGQSLGASAAVVGLMVSAYGGARLLVNLPAGYASERFGRRAMMSAGCAFLSIGSVVALVTTQVDAFFACLLMMGVASAFFMTSALAAVADLGTPGRRMQDMSLYQAANMVGSSMGPALGGLAAGLWGYGAPFTVNALLGLAGIFAFMAMPWREGRPTPRSATTETKNLGALARQGAGVGLMYFSIFYVRTASNWIILPLVAQSRFGMDLATIGLILTAGALANLGVLAFTPRMVLIFGRIWVIVIASCLTLAACAMLAFGDSAALLWLTAIFFGAGAGIATPTLTAYVAEVAPEGQRGPAMGLLRTMQDLALILGPLVSGLLSDRLGLGYQGGLYGCLAILGTATLVFRFTARG